VRRLTGRRADRDPLARELARVSERVDGIASLLAGIYQAEGLPVPPVLRPVRPSVLARVRHLAAVRDAR
jgi:hypothetical protein